MHSCCIYWNAFLKKKKMIINEKIFSYMKYFLYLCKCKITNDYEKNIGCEISENYCHMAEKRIDNERSQLSLF